MNTSLIVDEKFAKPVLYLRILQKITIKSNLSLLSMVLEKPCSLYDVPYCGLQ